MMIASITRLAAVALAAAALPAAAPVVAEAPSVPSATAARNKQIVTAAFDRWAASGSNIFEELLSADVVWTIEGSGPSAGRFEGREAFVARAVRPFVSRLSTPVRPVAKRIWADGDHVIANWEGEGVARDGAPYRNSYVWIFRMRDGKAVEVTAYLDLVPYDDVLRRVPAPVGRP
ncbi:nuclear transport factor 2 family protein [Sphingomonas sanxanigenens]|uniref:SnoaL-like domain-containing protein n=1 Tax=Sphingomonas sanxanigenens DSM 19645 = NX02 TaxID=1123269 RepID=W0AD83_9SPHN|nr:nuclear transport factor 2 family protein [Sphingomonas sanxanigenens]AHE54263.1 hypothetical protein NX02_12825 [Sphingomonas sanxanigenens DSM 19645 = NX02]